MKQGSAVARSTPDNHALVLVDIELLVERRSVEANTLSSTSHPGRTRVVQRLVDRSNTRLCAGDRNASLAVDFALSADFL